MKRQVVSTPAELVATVPYVIGYQPPSGAVAMVALGEGRVVVTACETKFADAGENGTSAEAFSHAARGAGADQIVVVGYGDVVSEGRALADRLTRALRVEPDTAGLDVVTAGVGGGRVALTWTDGTDFDEPMPNLAEKFGAVGIPRPAPTRDHLAARYAPYPVATFAVPDTQELAAVAPRNRIARALALLASPDDDLDASTRGADLAEFVALTGDTDVRDAVIAHLVHHAEPQRLMDTVMAAYQGAPVDQRPTVATLAAACAVLTTQPTMLIEAVLAHADKSARLTQLVSDVASESAMIPSLRKHFAQAPSLTVEAITEAAQARWEATQGVTTSAAPRWSTPRAPQRASGAGIWGAAP